MTSQKRNPARRVRLHFTFMAMLLYEAISEVVGVPVVVSGGAAPQTTSILQNQEGIKILTMPIWARKAGGNWKPELVQELIGESPILTERHSEYVLGEPENSHTEGVHEAGSEVRKRVDGEENILSATTNHNNHEEAEVEKSKSSTEEDSTQENEDQYEYEYEELRPEEQECPEDKFWHIRGLKCVPYDCPGGNAWRDRDTGDCILKYYGYRNRWRSRPWRP